MDLVLSIFRDDELIEYQIIGLLQNDDVEKFVSFIKSQLRRKNKDDDGDSMLCPTKLIFQICRYGAVKCAAALIRGEIGMTVDLNRPLQSGMFPLHHAAQTLCSGLTDLFISNGANVDLKCGDGAHNGGRNFSGLLPLNVAVETLGRHIDWTPKQSVFLLVLKLCKFDWKESLDTIRSLAEKTTDVRDIIFQYVAERKLVECAALLMVAWDRVTFCMHGDTDEGFFNESMTLRRCISTEIASLVDEECRMVGSGRDELALTKEKKRLTMDMLMLFEIFQRTGVRINTCMHFCGYDMFGGGGLVQGILSILHSAELPLKKEDASYLSSKDQIEYVGKGFVTRSGWKLPNGAVASWGRELLGKHEESRSGQVDISLQGQSEEFFPVGSFNRNRLITPRTRKCSSRKKQVLSSAALSFHTLRCSESSFNSDLCTTMVHQVKKPTKAIDRHLPHFLSSKKWFPLALALKRGMACV